MRHLLTNFPIHQKFLSFLLIIIRNHYSESTKNSAPFMVVRKFLYSNCVWNPGLFLEHFSKCAAGTQCWSWGLGFAPNKRKPVQVAPEHCLPLPEMQLLNVVLCYAVNDYWKFLHICHCIFNKALPNWKLSYFQYQRWGTLVPRTLHDTSEGGFSHMGGVALAKHVKAHMGSAYFERLLAAASTVLATAG